MPTARAESSAPVDRLWSACSDVQRWPEHLDTFASVHSSEDGPTRVGSRFAVRQPGLPAATYEVTQWVPGERFTWVARSVGVRTTASHEVTSTPTGSRVTLEVQWSGPLAWLVRSIAARKTQEMIDVEATTLAGVAETGR